MRHVRLALIVVCALFAGLQAFAQEEIRSFDVLIQVDRSGDITVTETIRINVEGREIRRGIFREWPAYYADEDRPGRLPFRYKVLQVEKDGRREPYSRDMNGSAIQLRIGDPDIYLDHREHTYSIQYRVKNQIRYGDVQDELYWNATGAYWLFPILEARVEIQWPDGAQVTDINAYTGGVGETGRAYTYRRAGAVDIFETTDPLRVREGLTVSVGINKGVIDPPSVGDVSWLWWARNGALTALGLSFLGLIGFYYRSFDRVGRDPAKGPVFPQYAPPEGYSPAAAHHIYYRGFRGHDGLIATLMSLAADGHMRIDVEKKDKKKTTLHQEEIAGVGQLSSEVRTLFTGLFSGTTTVKLGEKYDASFTAAYERFRKDVSKKFGSPYFKWNFGYVALGGILTLGTIIFAAIQASYWSGWHTLVVLGLIALNGLFMYLMPAPSRKGQAVRTHLQGFRLYMEKAEKLQLNAVEVGSNAPPPMTLERYETFLPFAVALGVEKPWTKHFERLIPEKAAEYSPTWTNMNAGTFGSIGGMTDGIVSGMSSGVSTAMPQSSSSSGGGGGGFSGGGGGGGGGGGW